MIDLYSDLSSSSIDPLASGVALYADAVAERERERERERESLLLLRLLAKYAEYKGDSELTYMHIDPCSCNRRSIDRSINYIYPALLRTAMS